jgi:hypothetical protein
LNRRQFDEGYLEKSGNVEHDALRLAQARPGVGSGPLIQPAEAFLTGAMPMHGLETDAVSGGLLIDEGSY